MKKQDRRGEPKEGLLIPAGEVRSVVIAAFRYYLGRQSAAVLGFGGWLESAWRDIEEGTRDIIARELEEAFADDDASRLRGKEYHRLGMDCDRAVWSRVRKMYRVPRCCLCGKEMGEGVAGSIHLDGEYSCDECAPPGCEVCGGSFERFAEIVPNLKTRRARHPGCEPKS